MDVFSEYVSSWISNSDFVSYVIIFVGFYLGVIFSTLLGIAFRFSECLLYFGRYLKLKYWKAKKNDINCQGD